MKQIADSAKEPPLTPAALRAWRQGYRAYLESKGVPPEGAADMAAKVAYRPDLYPQPGATPDMFQLVPPTTTERVKPAAKTTPKKMAKPSATVPNVIPAKPKEGPTTRRELKLIKASTLIATELAAGEDMAFTHAVLCQVGLPRSKVDGERFMRQSGTAWVSVQAGVLDEGKGPVLQPIPYGAMPRLALAWVSTYAKRHNTREVPIGESASEFLELLGQPTTGGPRGSYTTLRRQMHALAACRLQLGYKGRTYNGQPVEQFDAWVANRDSNQKALWPGIMLLSAGYHQELIENGVPLDNRALLALKGSALALDVYTWLAHRLHRVDGRQLLHWKSLREQFAQEYQGKDADKDFKKRFLLALRDALAVYPQAKVKQVTGGLLLLPSEPPINYKKLR
ncbi:plasmid encoded RepA protein [Ferrovum myxofaciens]|uniref:Plasmid encoded RepA protein n=2 Tax=Ferrovum myxofaciens TaxID=416213 RepID=A0A149VV96_9PROT|nr:plasmid encoded RepA protein [Ferrovum myxofaciens]